MLKMLTAHTFEVDDAEAAVREILEQLQSRGDLLKNSVGLLFCYLDFIKSGAAEAVCKALPFKVLGCTTLGAAAPGTMGDIILTLTVLTGDDVEFYTGLSEPLTEDEENRIGACYRETASPLQTPPALIFVFTPSLHNLAGDTVVAVLDRESRGEIPIFGAGALDADTKTRTPKTIYGGTAYSDRMSILLLSGNLKPRFFIDSVWKHDIHSQKALVNSAEGNRMITVNNMPAAAYMEKMGILSKEKTDMIFAFPIAIDQGRGVPPKLCVINDVNEDGSLTCSANIPAGCTLNIGSPGSGEVLATAKNITDAVKNEEGRGLFIFSCFSRSVIQSDPHDEMEMIRGELNNSPLPYLLIYSSGEICPVYDENSAAPNRYHNYAIIACLLEEDKNGGFGGEPDAPAG